MSEATIFQTMSLVNAVSDMREEEASGSLIRIYPTDDGCLIWPLDRYEISIGRECDCEICLEDEAASRRHASIERDDDGYLLVDLSSTNGTFVNNEAITEHRLVAGDRIRIGTHVLKYLSADSIELQYHETVFRMTTRDGLTEAYNRQYMSEFLERELSRSAERNRAISVALLDVDCFKNVNDEYGHLIGDEVLREVCRRAEGVLHAGDLFARYGGEEFCAIFCECNFEEAQALAEKIRLAIADFPFQTDIGELPITASIGVATWTGEGQELTPEQILKAADDKLYDAKKKGRNRVCTTVTSRLLSETGDETGSLELVSPSACF